MSFGFTSFAHFVPIFFTNNLHQYPAPIPKHYQKFHSGLSEINLHYCLLINVLLQSTILAVMQWTTTFLMVLVASFCFAVEGGSRLNDLKDQAIQEWPEVEHDFSSGGPLVWLQRLIHGLVN
ncbi:hypothetical protein ACHWQZ_G019585 [Mnemiopsis leidyi]